MRTIHSERKIAFLAPAADKAVAQRFLDSFLGRPMQLTLGEKEALCEGECLLAVGTPLGTTFTLGTFSPSITADQARAARCPHEVFGDESLVRKHPRDFRGVGGVSHALCPRRRFRERALEVKI